MSSYLFSTVPNYSGRQPDNQQYIKQFVASLSNQIIWIYKRLSTGELLITPSDQTRDVLIPKDLIVQGSIISPSDEKLKKNINEISIEERQNILNLDPKIFTYKNDLKNKKHFGFLAQDVEKIYPELITENAGYKTINYIELIPLLLSNMKLMQDEIRELKEKLEVEKVDKI
jgi:hypothetical protein